MGLGYNLAWFGWSVKCQFGGSAGESYYPGLYALRLDVVRMFSLSLWTDSHIRSLLIEGSKSFFKVRPLASAIRCSRGCA
jgi:hypothetical protein